MRKNIQLNLTLFEGEGAAAEGAAQTGEQGQTTTGSTSAAEPPADKPQETPEPTPEERKAAYEQFKKEYKDLFGEDVRNQVTRRYKENESLHQQLDAYSPLMSLLSTRYGIEDADVSKVMQAIENDNSFWEEQALKENMSVDQLKYLRKIEAQNRQLLDAGQRAQQIRQRDETYARWDREASQCKQLYPGFDLETECANEQFTKLLGAGFDITSAYRAVHFDDITQGLMAQTEKDTKKLVADNIRAGSGRPTENGADAPANQTKMDIWGLSQDEFHKLLDRARRGEEISF